MKRWLGKFAIGLFGLILLGTINENGLPGLAGVAVGLGVLALIAIAINVARWLLKLMLTGNAGDGALPEDRT